MQCGWLSLNFYFNFLNSILKCTRLWNRDHSYPIPRGQESWGNCTEGEEDLYVEKADVLYMYYHVLVLFICQNFTTYHLLPVTKCSTTIGWKARGHWFDYHLRHIFSFWTLACFLFLTSRQHPYKWNHIINMTALQL